MVRGEVAYRNLTQYIEDNREVIEDRDIAMLERVAALLAAGPVKILKAAYKNGYLDGTECSVTSNKHVHAMHMAEAYAGNIIKPINQR